MDKAVILDNVRGLSKGNIGVPLLLLVILAMVTLPVPPFLLDVLFTFNIALSIVVLLVCVYSDRPLDFAIFPTIILIATLMRLSLNVASTRVVLLAGHEGGDAAGKVIEAFGEVVVGGNYVVGFVGFPYPGYYQLCGSHERCLPYIRNKPSIYLGCHARVNRRLIDGRF